MKKKIFGIALGTLLLFSFIFTITTFKPKDARAESGQICRCHRLDDLCLPGAYISFRARCAAPCSVAHSCAVIPQN